MIKMKRTAIILAIGICLISGNALAERLAIKSDTANVRSGPGTNYEILWQVEKYHPIQIVKKQDQWYQFRDFEGDIGWVHASLVGKISTVITIRDKCNIRSGPGTKYKIEFNVGKGIPFKVLERKNKWLRILHADGDEGWIYESLVW
jgi:SH3-like domain-containing protein